MNELKNLPNYEDAYNNLLLMYTISYICVFIQTSIPSFSTKKIFEVVLNHLLVSH